MATFITVRNGVGEIPVAVHIQDKWTGNTLTSKVLHSDESANFAISKYSILQIEECSTEEKLRNSLLNSVVHEQINRVRATYDGAGEKAMTFLFGLKGKVKLRASAEAGEVVGRAEFSASGNQYNVHYKAGDGCARTAWFDEPMLEQVVEEKLMDREGGVEAKNPV